MSVEVELFVCWDDGTWTDSHFLEIADRNADDLTMGEWTSLCHDLFLADNNFIDKLPVHIGVSCVQDIYEDEDEDDEDYVDVEGEKF